jgi:site-specific recombinase XerD
MTDKGNAEALRVLSLGRERYRLVRDQGVVIEEVDRFLSAIEARNVSPRTVRAYAFDLLILYRWLSVRGAEESQSIEALTQSDLVDFIRFQQESDAKPTSINRRLMVAGLLYRFLTGVSISAGGERGVSLPGPYYKGRRRDRELGLLSIEMPRHRPLRVKSPRTFVEPLTREQVRLLIGSFKRYRDIAIAYLMLLCGLRSREVITLTVGAVNFDEQRLHVKGKGNRDRVLPMPRLLLRYLRDYLRLERPSVSKTNALFVVLKGQRRGRAMTTSGLRSLFRYRRRDEKIANANPHRLRHTFGTDMARSGVRLPILQRMMGHEDSKMTLRYIHLSMSDIAAEFYRAAKEIHKRYTDPE